jgi:plastocyanin
MRHARLALLAFSTVLALSACASEPATWTYAPAPSKTPSASAEASAGPSEAASGNIVITASGVKFVETAVDVPAGADFKIDYDNQDPGTPHDIVIHKGDVNGEVVFKGEQFPGVKVQTYDVPALEAGTYAFVCSIHPGLMTGVMTAK